MLNATTETLVNAPSLGLADLAAWVVATHHAYARAVFGRMPGLFERARAEGAASRDELARLETLVGALRAELEPHMLKEERVLFPFIAAMDRAAATGGPAPRAPFGTVANPVRMMTREHEGLEVVQRALRAALGSLGAAEHEGALGLRALCDAVRGLDEDLTRHARLEEDELFARATALEVRLAAR